MIDFDLLCEITEYARKHQESSIRNYNKRNQFNSDKIFHDCLNGKIAEFCLYFDLVSKGYKLDKPDLTIYSSKDKSYDSDLYLPEKDIRIHIKSISIKSSKLYGDSVVFQRNDPLVKSPKKQDYIAIMKQVDFLNYYTLKWLNSCEAQYEDTRTYLPTKCAIYL